MDLGRHVVPQQGAVAIRLLALLLLLLLLLLFPRLACQSFPASLCSARVVSMCHNMHWDWRWAWKDVAR